MARKNTDNGWVLGLFAVAIIFAVGRCSATNDIHDPSKPVAVLEAELPAPATTTMYVASASLNCRAEPRSTADVVAKLSLGDDVAVGEVQKGWAVTERPEGACWVAQRLLSEDKPEEAAIEAPQAPEVPVGVQSFTRAVEAVSERRGGQCGTKRKCGQMESCEEAYHYLNDCGVGRLDGDGDGVPCESICG